MTVQGFSAGVPLPCRRKSQSQIPHREPCWNQNRSAWAHFHGLNPAGGDSIRCCGREKRLGDRQRGRRRPTDSAAGPNLSGERWSYRPYRRWLRATIRLPVAGPARRDRSSRLHARSRPDTTCRRPGEPRPAAHDRAPARARRWAQPRDTTQPQTLPGRSHSFARPLGSKS